MARVAVALALLAMIRPHGAKAQPSIRWRDQVTRAEAAARRGDRTTAERMASAVVAEYTRSGTRQSAEHVLAGRAYVLLSAGNPEAARRALAAFDAGAADGTNLEAIRRAGDLFLEKYNAPDARQSYEAVLAKAPADAEALLGLAQVEEFEGKPTALATLRRALEANPRLVEAVALVARMQLEAETYDSATTTAQRAIALDATSLRAWSVLGATAWLTGDSATYQRALAAATALQPRPVAFFAELAEAAVRQRRYAEAVGLAERAVTFDSLSVRALGVLGTTQLRLGRMAAGQAALERAFRLDAFNVWHKNTLDLLDRLRTFRTAKSPRFELVAPAEEADLMALYLLPLLERAYDALAARYGYTPPTPVRLELFRVHADFSVRSVGLTGLGALGVSFGTLLAMDTPSARERGTFNWGSTAWHELAHTFTLGASNHRVPRWLTEGISVLEERRTARGWGANVSPPFLMALKAGLLRPMSQLNEGFLRPRFPDEIGFSYYQASLFCEMAEGLKGERVLPAMLRAYAKGHTTPQVFQEVLGLTPAQLDSQFTVWVRGKFAPLLAPDGRDSTITTSMKSVQMALDRGDTTAALTQLARITGRDDSAWEPNRLEAELRDRRGDARGAMEALERLLWIWPYDNMLHDRLADLATTRGEHGVAIRERRAILANQPADPLSARYELARSLATSGEVSAARRELLQLLEQAPAFEKAQALLLELRNREPDHQERDAPSRGRHQP